MADSELAVTVAIDPRTLPAIARLIEAALNVYDFPFSDPARDRLAAALRELRVLP